MSSSLVIEAYTQVPEKELLGGLVWRKAPQSHPPPILTRERSSDFQRIRVFKVFTDILTAYVGHQRMVVVSALVAEEKLNIISKEKFKDLQRAQQKKSYTISTGNILKTLANGLPEVGSYPSVHMLSKFKTSL